MPKHPSYFELEIKRFLRFYSECANEVINKSTLLFASFDINPLETTVGGGYR